MDAAIKYPPSNPMNFEGDAEAVTYGGGKLNTSLDYLSNLNFSTFGKKLIAADEAEFKRLLKVSSEDIWDECQNRWNLNTANFSTGQYKFGTQSLHVTARTSASCEPLTFGGSGNPFTINFWVRFSSLPSSSTIFFKAIAGNTPFGIMVYGGSQLYMCDGSSTAIVSGFPCCFLNMSAGTWYHVEIGSNGTTLYLFVNGQKASATKTIWRRARRITFGGIACNIDEFRVLDGLCLHTAAFTPPTSAYSVTSDTISLSHFE